MADIFISYAREDEGRIAELVSILERQGWSIFWDRKIPSGETWRSYIGKALDDAKCVIVAWSQNSVNSDWVKEEADDGKRRNILIPILIDPVEQPRGFREIQAADLTDWQKGNSSVHFDELVKDIRRYLGNPLNAISSTAGSDSVTLNMNWPAHIWIAIKDRKLLFSISIIIIISYIWFRIIGLDPLINIIPSKEMVGITSQFEDSVSDNQKIFKDEWNLKLLGSQTTAKVKPREGEGEWKVSGCLKAGRLALAYRSTREETPGIGILFLEYNQFDKSYVGHWEGLDCDKKAIVRCPYVLTTPDKERLIEERHKLHLSSKCEIISNSMIACP